MGWEFACEYPYLSHIECERSIAWNLDFSLGPRGIGCHCSPLDQEACSRSSKGDQLPRLDVDAPDGYWNLCLLHLIISGMPESSGYKCDWICFLSATPIHLFQSWTSSGMRIRASLRRFDCYFKGLDLQSMVLRALSLFNGVARNLCHGIFFIAYTRF